MKRKVDEYFNKYRKEFYEAEPPTDIWESIEKELFNNKPQKKKSIITPFWYWAGIAAAIVIAFTAGLFFWNHHQSSKAVINPDLAIVQQEYIRMIGSKKEELYRLKEKDPLLYADFIKDINELGLKYKQLNNSLYKKPHSDEIIVAMMMNLQAQIEALNQQLQIIEKLKKSNNSNYESKNI